MNRLCVTIKHGHTDTSGVNSSTLAKSLAVAEAAEPLGIRLTSACGWDAELALELELAELPALDFGCFGEELGSSACGRFDRIPPVAG